MKDFLDALKFICYIIMLFFALFGAAVIFSGVDIPNNILYIEDGNYIDAIEYENKIYVRKEGI